MKSDISHIEEEEVEVADEGSRGGRGGGSGRQGIDTPIALTEEFVLYVSSQLKALQDDPSVSRTSSSIIVVICLVHDNVTNIELTFPSTLDNSQRRYVHNVAAKQGFHSKSTGKNDARFIFVTRAKTTSSMTAVSLRVPPTPLALSAPTLHAMQAFLEAYPAAPPSS
ncbi:hypothetical protein DYB37_011398, partial [Aphanomyces astaci]